ncbi:dicarboxylate/amino acid:cation symporter [Alkalibacillus salilacus]|uniref:Na+/H+-dicarboxylate symporter n=1 Tax=Alkalibacillus salilacus TaxID=284582 RepID=A0ABT9VEP7_9BACI|nr:dicarboxylate/amino acid:cation symporter [Alkalibacillus salilacus]MDQ0159446.1 Na+/H+-dicarboxylate symporter [Alkalibacillus salilacus]
MKSMLKAYWNGSLIVKISVALILGVLVGLVFGESVVPYLNPFGELLIRLLKFLILPLILFTLIVGVNQTNIRDLGRMGGKVLGYYTVTSAVAIIVGVSIALLLAPGEGMSLDPNESYDSPEHPGIASVLLNIVPENIVTAFNDLNLLGIIFTAITFGVALAYMRQSDALKQQGEMLYQVIEALNEATFKIMRVILQYLPIGVFAIIATTVAEHGIDTLTSLGEFILVLYLALIVQLILYLVFIKLTGHSPWEFLKGARTPMITAFVTQSSSGTLPVTLNAARQMQLHQPLYSFSLPFGATVNMDGAAIRIAVSAVFAATVIGEPLSIAEVLTIVIIGTLASIGTAGVPGAGIVMIATVFAQLGLPMEAVALLTAVDALVGMGCTALNVTGDLVGTKIINRSEEKNQN